MPSMHGTRSYNIVMITPAPCSIANIEDFAGPLIDDAMAEQAYVAINQCQREKADHV